LPIDRGHRHAEFLRQGETGHTASSKPMPAS